MKKKVYTGITALIFSILIGVTWLSTTYALEGEMVEDEEQPIDLSTIPGGILDDENIIIINSNEPIPEGLPEGTHVIIMVDIDEETNLRTVKNEDGYSYEVINMGTWTIHAGTSSTTVLVTNRWKEGDTWAIDATYSPYCQECNLSCGCCRCYCNKVSGGIMEGWKNFPPGEGDHEGYEVKYGDVEAEKIMGSFTITNDGHPAVWIYNETDEDIEVELISTWGIKNLTD